jgi:UDP-3-O-[3-hydroxymyristoyl] glucosamine N-acyltransferase
MKFTAKQIAGILDGTVEGNPETEVHQLSKIEEGELGSISFLANKKYNPFIYKTGASIVIVNNDLILDKEVAPTLIRVKDAYQAFSTLLEFYNQIDDNQEGIMEPVSIDKSVRINSSCYVGEFTVIKQNVSLGDHVKIDSQCYIGKNVTIGAGTKIHSGSTYFIGYNNRRKLCNSFWMCYWLRRFWFCTTTGRNLQESSSNGYCKNRE